MYKDKKGQMSLDLVGKILITVLVLALIAVAMFAGFDAIQNSGIFTAASASANNTDVIITNVTDGATAFFGNIPAILSILGIVAIMTGLAILIVVVKRSNSGGGL